MARINDYDSLKTAIGNLIDRPELVTDGTIETFIQLFEADWNNDPNTRLLDCVKHAGVVITDGSVSYPDDYREMIKFRNADATRMMEPYPAKLIEEMDRNSWATTDGPRFFRHAGDYMEIYPTASAENPVNFTMEYYSDLPQLGTDDGQGGTIDTNWLLAKSPTVYLYGSAIHSAPYLDHDERLQVWDSLNGAAVGRLLRSDKRAKASGLPQRFKNRGAA